MLASSVILSGNNFNKINLFLHFSNVGDISRNFFFANQSNYVVPVINDTFTEMIGDTTNRLQGEDLILIGKF